MTDATLRRGRTLAGTIVLLLLTLLAAAPAPGSQIVIPVPPDPDRGEVLTAAGLERATPADLLWRFDDLMSRSPEHVEVWLPRKSAAERDAYRHEYMSHMKEGEDDLPKGPPRGVAWRM